MIDTSIKVAEPVCVVIEPLERGLFHGDARMLHDKLQRLVNIGDEFDNVLRLVRRFSKARSRG